MLRIIRSSNSVDDAVEGFRVYFREVYAIRKGCITDRQVSTLLRNLRRSRYASEALESVQELYVPLNTETSREYRQDAAEKIARLDGVATIQMALEKWYLESRELCDMAFQLLIRITFFAPRAKRFIVNSGGVTTIISAANAHVKDKDYNFQSSAVGLLCNLSLDIEDDLKREVADEECVDFVIKTMEMFPGKHYVQKRGCIYFYEIAQIPDQELQDKIHSKKPGQICLNALEKFRNTKNEDVYRWAREALIAYAKC